MARISALAASTLAFGYILSNTPAPAEASPIELGSLQLPGLSGTFPIAELGLGPSLVPSSSLGFIINLDEPGAQLPNAFSENPFAATPNLPGSTRTLIDPLSGLSAFIRD